MKTVAVRKACWTNAAILALFSSCGAANADVVAAPKPQLAISQESVCDLVPAGQNLGVRRDGSVYVKGKKAMFGSEEEQFCVPDVVMTDKTNVLPGRSEASQVVAAKNSEIVQQYKKINKELPSLHSHRTGLAGLSRKWQ